VLLTISCALLYASLPRNTRFGTILFGSIEVKPGVFGFRIDLKKLFGPFLRHVFAPGAERVLDCAKRSVE